MNPRPLGYEACRERQDDSDMCARLGAMRWVPSLDFPLPHRQEDLWAEEQITEEVVKRT